MGSVPGRDSLSEVGPRLLRTEELLPALGEFFGHSPIFSNKWFGQTSSNPFLDVFCWSFQLCVCVGFVFAGRVEQSPKKCQINFPLN